MIASLLILTLATLLQISAAIIAIKLIRITGTRTAWIFISVAILLMSFRRIIPIVRTLFGNGSYEPDLANEVVGLAISTFMLLGIYCIGPYFVERLSIEQKLKLSELKHRKLLEQLPAIFISFLTDEARTPTFVGRNWITLGYSPEDLLANKIKWFDLIHKDDKPRMELSLKECLTTKSDVVIEFRMQNSLGDTRNMCGAFTTVVTDDESGSVDHIQGVIEDVTYQIASLEEKDRMITELQDAAKRIQTLKGLVPICAECKKIRDDNGFWQTLEAFVKENSNTEFSHGLCPICTHKIQKRTFG